jgi:hypothetical protein
MGNAAIDEAVCTRVGKAEPWPAEAGGMAAPELFA